MFIPEHEHGLLASAMRIAIEQWRLDAIMARDAGDGRLQAEFQRYISWAKAVAEESE